MANETSIIKPKVTIKVFGVGGGNSVLMRMAANNELGIDLIAINTDAKQLERAHQAGVLTMQIGADITKGRGTGGSIEAGEAAAKDAKEKIRDAMTGADLVFITAGMGGGTGTGAAPIVAKIAQDLGVLAIGVVTVPFSFEGKRKLRLATEGIHKMQSSMDALIAVQNDNLMKLPENRRMSMVKAFICADNVLKQAINCVAELILTTGVINVDFADVTTIFRQSTNSDALLGIGHGHTALDAVKGAVASPLIDRGIKGARGIILNLTGDNTLSLYDVDEATRYVFENADPEVNIIFGTVINDEMKGEVRATLIATDFVDEDMIGRPPVAPTQQQTAKTAPQAPKQTGSFSLEPPKFMQKKNKGTPGFPSFPSFDNK